MLTLAMHTYGFRSTLKICDVYECSYVCSYFLSLDDVIWTQWWMILIYCIIFSLFLFSIIILLIYVLCTGGLIKRKAAEDTTQLYDDTANFEGMYWYVYSVLLSITKHFHSSSWTSTRNWVTDLGEAVFTRWRSPRDRLRYMGKTVFHRWSW